MSVPQLVNILHQQGATIAALTDHNSLVGMPTFFKLCEEKNIKPVAGITLKIHSKKALGEIVVIARNIEGYQTLRGLEALSLSDQHKYDPTSSVSLESICELLENKTSNLIAIDGFNGSVTHKALQNSDQDAAINILNDNTSDINKLRNLFSLDKYLYHRDEKSILTNAFDKLLTNGSRIGVSACKISCGYAENDDDLKVLQQWMSLASKKFREQKNIPDIKFDKQCEKYLDGKVVNAVSDPDELRVAKWFSNKIEPLNLYRNNIDISLFNEHGNTKRTITDILNKHWPTIAKRLSLEEQKKYAKRISYELSVIRQGEDNFEPYFMNVYRIKEIAEQNNIHYMLRGSGVSSLILHTLGLTPIDPIKEGLLFERFLSPDRNEEPDIDIEFSNPKKLRQALRASLSGEQVAALSKVSGISSTKILLESSFKSIKETHFEKWKPKQKNQFQAYFKSLINSLPERSIDLNKWLSYNENRLKQVITKSPEISLLIERAETLNTGQLSTSVSESAIVVPEGVQTQFSTLQGANDHDLPIILLDKRTIKPTGLIKYDLLSNVIFSRTSNAMHQIGLDVGAQPEREHPAIKAVFSTNSLLQVSQTGQKIGRSLSQMLHPTNFDDITALVALIRDGSQSGDNEIIKRYRKGRNDNESLNLMRLEPFLKPTYGVMLYEEQLMEILTKLAGYSWRDADDFRSKLKNGHPTVVDDNEARFIEQTMALNNCSESEASSYYQPFREKKGKFVFSKAHSLAYANIVINQCILKVNHPAQYYAELFAGNNKAATLPIIISEWEALRTYSKNNQLQFEIEGLNVLQFMGALRSVVEREVVDDTTQYKTNITGLLNQVKKHLDTGELDSWLGKYNRDQVTSQIDKITHFKTDKTPSLVKSNNTTPKERSYDNTGSYSKATNEGEKKNIYKLIPAELLVNLEKLGLITILNVERTKARTNDHIKFSFNLNESVQPLKVSVLSLDPTRMSKMESHQDPMVGCFQGNNALYEDKEGFKTPSLLTKLWSIGVFGSIPAEANTKDFKLALSCAKSELYKACTSKGVSLTGYINTTEFEKERINDPKTVGLKPTYPKSIARLQELSKQCFQDYRGISESTLAKYFSSGLLIEQEFFSGKVFQNQSTKKYFSQKKDQITALFRTVKNGRTIFDPPDLFDAAIPSGGIQQVYFDKQKNKSTTLDHATNGLSSLFFGMPHKGAEYLWFNEGLFDTLSFEENQSILNELKLPHAEPNCISIKSAGMGQKLIAEGLGIDIVNSDGVVDFRLKSETTKVPLTDKKQEALREFVSQRVIYVVQSSEGEDTLSQLSAVLSAAGVRSNILNVTYTNESNRAKAIHALHNNELLNDGAILIHSGNIDEWLRNNKIEVTGSIDGFEAFEVKEGNTLNPFYSKLNEQEKSKLKAELKRRFHMVFGCQGLGLALDHDKAGLTDAIVLSSICCLIDLPVRHFMPEKNCNFNDPNGQPYVLKDHNDYLKLFKQYSIAGMKDEAYKLMEHYSKSLSPAPKVELQNNLKNNVNIGI
jgi:hypothetical protein